MIGFLRGRVAQLQPESCFLDVQGVGYRLAVSEQTRRTLSMGEDAMLFTHLQVREDALSLFGFSQEEEYELFLHLIGVSGIGPKSALAILSAIQPQELRRAVCQKQTALLVKLPGIGKKTAERLVLELKDKLGGIPDLDETGAQAVLVQPDAASSLDEALLALESLGYGRSEAMASLRKFASESLAVEELIRKSLGDLSGGRQ